MRRMLVLALLAALLPAACSRQPERASDEKFITMDEWNKMEPPEKFDPYTLEHLKK